MAGGRAWDEMATTPRHGERRGRAGVAGEGLFKFTCFFFDNEINQFVGWFSRRTLWHQRNEYSALLCARRGRPVDGRKSGQTDGGVPGARCRPGVGSDGGRTGGGTDGGTAPVGEQGAHAHVKAQKRKRRRAPQNVSGARGWPYALLATASLCVRGRGASRRESAYPIKSIKNKNKKIKPINQRGKSGKHDLAPSAWSHPPGGWKNRYDGGASPDGAGDGIREGDARTHAVPRVPAIIIPQAAAMRWYLGICADRHRAQGL